MAKVSEVKVDIKLNTEEIIKELKSVQREAKKASKAVKELESLDAKSISLAEKLLEQSIESGVLMTDLKDNIRGIGKSTALIKKSNELKVPIIVGNTTVQRGIVEYAHSLGVELQCYNGQFANELRGKRFTMQSFLVDDSATNEIIIELQGLGFKCIGGFNSLKTSVL